MEEIYTFLFGIGRFLHHVNTHILLHIHCLVQSYLFLNTVVIMYCEGVCAHLRKMTFLAYLTHHTHQPWLLDEQIDLDASIAIVQGYLDARR